MNFSTITDRLLEILTDRKADLINGLLERTLALEAAYWRPHFSSQSLFIWREGLRNVEHGGISGAGLGTAAHGEIEGAATWIIAPYLRFTGAEETAAAELSKLAWNLLTVMAGYTRDVDNNFMACLLTGSTVNYRQGGTEGGWYVGEEFSYSVSWDLTF